METQGQASQLRLTILRRAHEPVSPGATAATGGNRGGTISVGGGGCLGEVGVGRRPDCETWSVVWDADGRLMKRGLSAQTHRPLSPHSLTSVGKLHVVC